MRFAGYWCAIFIAVAYAGPAHAGAVKGDANCDGRIDAADLPAIVAAAEGGPGGCERADVNGSGDVTSDDLGDEMGIVFPPFEEFAARVEDFECLLNWTKVRNFRITNKLGHLDDALAVAHGEQPLPYPAGTIIQLIPNEAMVKRGDSFDLDNADWEYFFLNVDFQDGHRSIVRRGRDEVFNFGPAGNCFGCHSGGRDFDFICEENHGCVALNLSPDAIDRIQKADPLCK